MKAEIRLEAIGGQGAHSAGEILAEAAVLGRGYQGNHFSSFGSEKRGSPVRSSVRYRDDGKPVRSVSPILRPDVLAVFHTNLLALRPETYEGSHPAMVLVVSTGLAPASLPLPPELACARIVTVDALEIARRHQAGLNSVMLGALAAQCPGLAWEDLRQAFSRHFHQLAPDALQRNLSAMAEGRARTRVSPGTDRLRPSEKHGAASRPAFLRSASRMRRSET